MKKKIQMMLCLLFISAVPASAQYGFATPEEAFQDYLKHLLSPAPQVQHMQISLGSEGNGKTVPGYYSIGIPRTMRAQKIPLIFGPSYLPFVTVRADLSQPTNTLYPYRAVGKMFIQNGDKPLTCGGTLIKPGIVLTAAHCVTKHGLRRFYQTRIKFIPGYRDGDAPYGTWYGRPFVTRAYFEGTSPCDETGRICQDDIAILHLEPQSGHYPGEATGWLGYGWNGYGFTDVGLTQVTQLGYPGCLNQAEYLQRNDAQGYRSTTQHNNTLIPSLMCGGASGGPWVVNFGFKPTITGTSPGEFSEANIIIGVTSWVNVDIKQNGASPFLNSNVAGMVAAICKSAPYACKVEN